VGHDVTHYVDVLGAEYDTTGRERRWFTAEDLSGLTAMAAPLDAEFAAYRPYPDIAVNGTLTERENVADLGGLEAAFEAYRAALGGKVADKAALRKSDREFFLAFAQSYRARLSEKGMRTQVASNDHAPETYRVATVRNLDAWYDAFDVKPGDRLYLEPRARVKVW
jgi:predicted metalloendopeptidase